MIHTQPFTEHLNGSLTNPFNRTSICAARSKICHNNHAAKDFLKWFEGSVVCDKRGYPLIQYHGTQTDLGGTNFVPYSHFGNANAANGFAGFNRHTPNQPAECRGGVVYPVILNIKKPLGIPDISIHPIWNIIEHLNKWGIISNVETRWINAAENKKEKHPSCSNKSHLDYIKHEYPNMLFAHYRLEDCSEDFWKAERLTKVLKDKNYDSIAYTNTYEFSGHTSWIVFDPKNQVKMATDVAALGVPLTHSSNFRMLNTKIKTYKSIGDYIMNLNASP